MIIERKDEIALLDSLDMGKPVREALADLGDAISACDHFASLAEEQVDSILITEFCLWITAAWLGREAE